MHRFLNYLALNNRSECCCIRADFSGMINDGTGLVAALPAICSDDSQAKKYDLDRVLPIWTATSGAFHTTAC